MGMTSGLAAAVVLAVLLAGCGGSGDEEPSSYALAPTRACLQSEDGVKVSTKDVDFVASTALGGAMRVTVSPENFVVMAFGDDEGEAERIERAYRDFAGKRIPIDDVLERRKNLVLVWNAPPTGEDESALSDCLKGAG